MTKARWVLLILLVLGVGWVAGEWLFLKRYLSFVLNGYDAHTAPVEWYEPLYPLVHGDGASLPVVARPTIPVALLAEVGLVESLIELGYPLTKVGLRQHGIRVAALDLSCLGGPFPFLLVLPQTCLEAALELSLRREEVEVCWEHQALTRSRVIAAPCASACSRSMAAVIPGT